MLDTIDLATLPHESFRRYDSVPMFPTRAEFLSASILAKEDPDPVAIWRREAIRWRIANENRPLDLKAIASATAEAMRALGDL